MRLSEDTFAAIQTRCVHEDVALEVDHMILDYTAYQAIKACLASRNHRNRAPSSISLSASVSMVNSFLPIFKARHPTYKADPELKFRVKLLQLVTLFTQRLTRNPTTPSETSLTALRESDKERTQKWILRTNIIPSSSFDVQSLDDQFPISSHELKSNRAHVLQELSIPAEDGHNEDAFYGTLSTVSLLDLLGLFMEVSAARNAMSASQLSERWMQLASEFMLQACLEQYLVVGTEGSDAIDMAFAWGYDNEANDELQHVSEINDMFEDEEYAMEVKGWSGVKGSYLEHLLLPNEASKPGPSGTSDKDGGVRSLVSHFEAIAAEFPIAAFESSILEFLESLSKSVPEPVLAQLESGNLHGMSKEETEDFLAGCGVNMARLFEA